MPIAPIPNKVFDGQDYQLMYLTFGDSNTPSTEIESFDIDLTDGGEDVKTLVKGYAGRCGGAAMCTLNFSGAVPYMPKDSAGVGTENAGMTVSQSAGNLSGVTLEHTMLSPLNTTGNTPITFVAQIGKTKAQQLLFKGQIGTLKFSTGVGKAATFSGTATGTFSVFSSQ
jgi:hypothetical protein